MDTHASRLAKRVGPAGVAVRPPVVFDMAKDEGELPGVAQERTQTAGLEAACDFLRNGETGNLWELRLD